MLESHRHLSKPSGWIILSCYLFAWLILPVLLTHLFPAAVSVLCSLLGGVSVATYIVAALLWSILIFAIWILLGDESSAHRKNFASYKSIWMGFLIAVTILLIANFRAYFYVVDRVAALRGTASMLTHMIAKATVPETSVKFWVEKGLSESRQLSEDLETADTFQDMDREKVGSVLRNLRESCLKSGQMAKLSAEIVSDLVTQFQQLNGKGYEARGTSFEPLKYITDKLKTIVDQMDTTYGQLLTAAKAAVEARAGADAEDQMDKLKLKAVELKAYYSEANALIASAGTALDAGQVDILAPFLLVSVLYAVFLLLPWALLFLFLLRKRDYLANEKANLLTSLHLDEPFLQRALSAREMSNTETDKKGKVAETVGDLAFRNIEYLVSLIFFTVITAAIWHFFFYPHAWSGLADLISRGGSIKEFGAYLSQDASPITFGFLGAYFFVIQMLLRRYFASDLNPKAYINAVVRLLVVFILSLFFLLIPIKADALNTAAITAFVIGIFPRVGLIWILRTANKLVRTLKAPGYIDRDPLTELDGLNTWHEARLFEEKVENIQNLATTPLADLIIHTNFSPLQLVDWVDQSLLYIHTRENWTEAFRAVGIRTSTDLLANTCRDVNFDRNKASILATAVNTAHTFNIPAPDSPEEEVRLAAAKLHRATADAAQEAREALALSQVLAGGKPEALDAVVALQTEINGMVESVYKLRDQSVKKAALASQQLPAGAGDLATKAKNGVAAVETSTSALCVEADALKQAVGRLDRKNPQTLTELAEVRERLDIVCGASANLKAQINAAVKNAERGTATATVQTEFAALISAFRAAGEASVQALKAAQKSREMAAFLDKDKPETLNRITALQIRLRAVSETVGTIQRHVKASRKALKGIYTAPIVVKEARKDLDAAAEAAEKLAAAVQDASDAAGSLDMDKPATLAVLPAVQESMTVVAQTADRAESRGQTAAGILQIASAPPQMSTEILQVMVNSIVEGPNIRELAFFWKRRYGE